MNITKYIAVIQEFESSTVTELISERNRLVATGVNCTEIRIDKDIIENDYFFSFRTERRVETL